ncbi:RDD family protein [Paenibacillus sp. NPDC056579]|uniref:RDD family protein n=1 Tax=Paenibacillus sp. NPDC056579 TaxID=3345871 RepID=UPI0036952D53
MKTYRFLAFLLDHLILSFVYSAVLIFLSWESLITPNESNFNKPFEIFYPLLAVTLLTSFMKDIFNGRSIGKRIFKLAVRDADNLNQVPNKFRLFIRNIPLVIWPLEIILLLIINKRIGDLIARTQVIRTEHK